MKIIKMIESSEEKNLIIFCKTPRTRNEICHYLGINSVSYVMKKICYTIS